MARSRSRAAASGDTVVLVSPDGEQERETTVGSEQEIKLRWNGYLPADRQKLEAPKVETPSGEQTVGTNAV